MTRTINHKNINVAELVENAMGEASTAKNYEKRIIEILVEKTGVTGFYNQAGKLDFSSTENAIKSVNSYLDRRIAGQHRNYSNSRKGW